jgi:glutathione S-transferase
MRQMENQIPEWGEANKPRAMAFLALLDRELGQRLYVVGDHYSVADITGLVAVDFMKAAKLELPQELANVRRWHAQVAARPSARA